jgi:hypothetical protein
MYVLSGGGMKYPACALSPIANVLMEHYGNFKKKIT